MKRSNVYPCLKKGACFQYSSIPSEHRYWLYVFSHYLSQGWAYIPHFLNQSYKAMTALWFTLYSRRLYILLLMVELLSDTCWHTQSPGPVWKHWKFKIAIQFKVNSIWLIYMHKALVSTTYLYTSYCFLSSASTSLHPIEIQKPFPWQGSSSFD